jgi:16S rRNA (guanine527-N7)-methyltransferase
MYSLGVSIPKVQFSFFGPPTTIFRSMELDRIAALLRPFLQEADSGTKAAGTQHSSGAALNEHQLQSILTYIDILLRWNARTNLTAVRDPEEIVTRHFGESLFTARHLFPHDRQLARSDSPGTPSKPDFGLGGEVPNYHLLDLGSGAGFPGVPIKIWAPQIHLTLVESNQKKATFLKEVCRALTLTDVNVLAARAEMPQNYPRASPDYSTAKASLSPQPIPPADIVTLRAVERFDQALSIAASLVKPRGRLALLISRQQLSIAHTQVPSYVWQDSIPIPQSSNRVLLIGRRYPINNESIS